MQYTGVASMVFNQPLMIEARALGAGERIIF
jgi:hypothetical protein